MSYKHSESFENHPRSLGWHRAQRREIARRRRGRGRHPPCKPAFHLKRRVPGVSFHVINGETRRLLHSALMLRTPFPIGREPEGPRLAAPGAVPDTSEVGAHSAHHRRGRPTITRKSVQGPALGTPYLIIPVGPLGVSGGPSGRFHRGKEVPAHPQVPPVTAEGSSWTFSAYHVRLACF
jgi:hypothetical protein